MSEVKETPVKRTKSQAVVVTDSQLPATPENLLFKAVEMGASLEHLEKLMDLQDRWEKKEAIKKYFAAMSEFQSMAPDLKKNKLVKFDHKDGQGKTEYKYQELGDIADHIREPLANCGLSYRWEQTEKDGNISVVCIVSHSGGHFEKSEPLTGRADDSGKKNSIQQKASTITYLRRYTLTGMLGLSSSDKDDDGKGGAKNEAGNGLPNLKDGQILGAISKIMAGETTLEKIKESVNVSKSQEEQIIKATQK